MNFHKRIGIGFSFASTSAALVLCALALMSAMLNASVVSISSITNHGAATGSVTLGGGTVQATQDVTSLLAINTAGAGNTALFNVGLGKILQDARALGKNGDLVLFNYGTSILFGSGSNGTGSTNISGILSLPGTVTLGTGNFAFTDGILELGNSNFTRAFGAGVGQVNLNSASSGADFAAFGADRMLDLGGSGATVTWGAGNDTLSSVSITATRTGILTASTDAIQSDTGIPILAGPGSTMTKTPVEPDAVTAIRTWTGLGADNNTSTAANWGGTAPVANDVLAFAGTTRLTPNQVAALTINSLSFNSGAGAFTLGGAGYTIGTAAGIVNNSTATETINNAITLAIAQTWSATSGNLVFGGNIANGGFLLTIGGASDTSASGIISGTGGLTKSGTGTLTLSGVNTYTGATTVSAGILNIQNATGLGTIAGGTTVSSGATLQLQGGITVGAEALNITGIGASGETGALVNVSGTNNYGGLLTLAGATTLSSDSGTLNLTNIGTITGGTFGLTLAGAGDGSISSIIGTTSGTLTKNGTGTWTLSGANTYTGVTTVNAGTLIAAANNALGTTAHTDTVNSGGTLGVQGGITLNANQTISISGTGAAGRTGAIDNISGTNTIAGPINVANNVNSQIGATAGALTLSGNINISPTATVDSTLSFNPASGASITVSGRLTDTGSPRMLNVAQIGNGTLTFSNATNNYWGNTSLGIAGGTNTGTLRLGISGALTTANGASIITIYSGTLDLNNFNASATNLVLGGGGTGSIAAVTTGTGTLTLNAGLTYNATNNPLGATISGNLVLGPNAFAVGDSTAAAVDLTVSAVVSGPAALTKTGLGTMMLSGANTYTGATTVSAGVLNVQNNTGLGTIAGGTTVSNGATMQFQNGVTIGNEALNIRGTGAAGQTGALVNVSGTNNYGGLLTLAGATTLSSDSGTLNLTNAGTITGATFGLTLAGAGNGSVSSIIGTTSGSLTKSGTGTWTLSGANTFTGATTVNGGTLVLANGSGSALGFTSGITVNSGGTLFLGASNQINNTATITLNGGTFAKGNFSEGSSSTAGVGALNLTAAGSHLDFGSGTVGTLTFASFAPGGTTLTIDNWTGTFGTVGTDGLTDRLIFASDQSGILGSFNFTGFGPGAVEFNLGNGYFEIVPVPEAGTYFSGSVVLALILLHHRKQLRQLVYRWRASRKLRFSVAHGTGVAS